mmetsp:Transcript_13715/g.38954  ORF Transcript_13715/g.38954 Transcript_13715/m.38954 type:complete len:291 (+) Transcript_13715:640-1512(+)
MVVYDLKEAIQRQRVGKCDLGWLRACGKTALELLGCETQMPYQPALHPIPTARLARQDRHVRPVEKVERDYVGGRAGNCFCDFRRDSGLAEHLIENNGETRGIPFCIQGDLAHAVLDCWAHPRCKEERQAEVRLTRADGAAAGFVNANHSGVQGGGQSVAPDPDRQLEDERRWWRGSAAGPRHLVHRDAGLGANKRLGELEGHANVVQRAWPTVAEVHFNCRLNWLPIAAECKAPCGWIGASRGRISNGKAVQHSRRLNANEQIWSDSASSSERIVTLVLLALVQGTDLF